MTDKWTQSNPYLDENIMNGLQQFSHEQHQINKIIQHLSGISVQLITKEIQLQIQPIISFDDAAEHLNDISTIFAKSKALLLISPTQPDNIGQYTLVFLLVF
eukprot:429690_1